MRIIGKNNLYRGLAIFFCLFALADIMNPHLCSEELGGSYFPESIAAASDPHNPVGTILTRRSESHEDKHNDSGIEIEDCFCCCSHILPSFALIVDSLSLKPPASEPELAHLPIPPPEAPFHPPRLS